MAHSYQIDPVAGLAIISVQGEVDGRGLVEAARQLSSDPHWQPDFCRLWDWRGITFLELNPEDVRAFVAQLRLARMRSRSSAIVAVREVDLGVARLVKAYERRSVVEVFTTMEEALAWVAGQAARP